MTNLINFKLEDNFIWSEHDQVYFYRIIPPNLSILTDREKKQEIQKLQGIFDALDIPLLLFGMDKTENFEENKAFYETVSDKMSQYREAIVNRITSIEVSESSSIQRAYYFVFKPASPEKKKQFDAALNGQMIHYYPVRGQELVTILRNFYLREFDSAGLHLPDEDESKENASHKRKPDSKEYVFEELSKRLLPVGMTFNSKYCSQNGFLRKTILIKNFPANLSVYCYLSNLSKIKNTTFSMRLSPMTTSLAEAIDRQINNERSNPLIKKKVSELIKSDLNQSSMAKFYRTSQERNSQAYYVNIFIELYGADEPELAETLNQVRSCLKSQHITFDELTYEQQDGFRSVSPLGSDRFSACANNMPANTLASLYPFSHSSRNDPQGLLLGTTVDGGDMFVDFYRRTEQITNGNFGIIGDPGQGKSYLLKKVLSLLLILGTTCFALDPENEFGDIFRQLGGTVIDCADGKYKLNPFEVRRMRADLEEQEESGGELPPDSFLQGKMFFQHLSWLKDFFSVLYPEADSLQIKALMLLVQELYELVGITENTNFAALQHSDYPTFTNLYKYIETTAEGYEQAPHKIIPLVTLKELLLILKDSYDGSLGYVFNGITNIPDTGSICFFLRDLIDGSEERMQAVIFNIMTYIWGRIVLKENRICIALDELYLLMNRKNYTVASYLKNFTKRGRKYDAIIGTATQNINDFLDPQIYHISAPIFNNTNFKFIFYSDVMEQDQVQSLLKLTDGEMDRISAPRKKHCIMKAGGDSFYMEINEFPYESQLFGKGGGR